MKADREQKFATSRSDRFMSWEDYVQKAQHYEARSYEERSSFKWIPRRCRSPNERAGPRFAKRYNEIHHRRKKLSVVHDRYLHICVLFILKAIRCRGLKMGAACSHNCIYSRDDR